MFDKPFSTQLSFGSLLLLGTTSTATAVVSSSALGLLVVLLTVAIWFLLRRLRQSLEERDRLKHRFAEETEQVQTVIHTIREGIITTDAQGRIKILNPLAEKFTGWHQQAAQGQLVSEVFPLWDQSTQEPLTPLLDRLLQEGQQSKSLNPVILRARDQSERLIETVITIVHSQKGEMIGSVIVFRETAPLNLPINKPLWQDQFDALTRLFNRQAFEECLAQAIVLSQRDNQEHSVCFLDLDRFREINRLEGFNAGDELLRQVSSLLQAKIRRADTVARLGGDEFAILLYRCPADQAIYIAQSLTQTIKDFQFEWQGKTLTIEASIGLVSVTANSDAIDLLKAAELACTAAKAQDLGKVYLS